MFNMTKNKKVLLISSISLAVIIVLGIVYAAFTQQLNINGSATGRSSKWDIHFENLSNVFLNGTAKELTSPTIKNNSTTIGDYSVSLTSPGDYVEYTFDVVNDGDYDATLTGLQKTSPSCTGTGENASTDASNVCGKLTYTLTYADGQAVSQNDTLASKETKTMKLKLLYQEFNDASLLPKMDVTISGLGIQLTYTQNGNAKVNSNGTTPYVAPSYAVGDQITVANETYHIISVPAGEDYVVALKDNPLTTSEVTTYGAGHINVNNSSLGAVYDVKGDGSVGGMAYYTSATCGNDEDQSGCTTSYTQSEVKYVVDAWAAAKFTHSELKTVDGYAARLIAYNEYVDFPTESVQVDCCGGCGQCISTVTRPVYDWLYSSDYWYWTMTPGEDSSNAVWKVENLGNLIESPIQYSSSGAVRPVINVYKSKISS